MKTILYKIAIWLLDLLAKKAISDNLKSFKIDLKKIFDKGKVLKQKLIMFAKRHQFTFDTVDFYFGRIYLVSLFATLMLSAILCTVEYFNHSGNDLGFQLFKYKLGLICLLMIIVSFLPLPQKPVRLKV